MPFVGCKLDNQESEQHDNFARSFSVVVSILLKGCYRCCIFYSKCDMAGTGLALLKTVVRWPLNTSAGVRYPRHRRGVAFIVPASACRPPVDSRSVVMLLCSYRRKRLLVFSTAPFC